MVTENMYGDILSDLASELVGSLGLAPSTNSNEILAMAQAAHGSALYKLKLKDSALLLSGIG
jgi:3-isopropylmalate dehydrogenase